MNRISRSLALAATCACSLSFLADQAFAQGQPQPQGGGAAGDRGGRQQPGNRGNNGGGDQGGRGQRGGGFGGGGGGFGGGMFGGGGGRALFEPSVTTEELDKYGKTLNLTKAQNEAVKSLHDAYVQDFDAAAQKARDEMDAIREEARDDPSRFQEMGELFTKFRTKRTAMETSFFNDVKATLTPEQQQVWPTIERTRRRETTMNRGLMSGERVDLVKIVDGLKLAADAHKPVDPILDQYQIDLDRELIVRNEQQEKFQGNMRDLFTGGGDQTKMQKMIDDGRAAAMKVRDVNKRYARQVEAALPEDVRAKFTEEVRRESFPNIYRGGSYATRVLDAVAGMNDLTAEQKSTVKDIQDRYNRDMGALNQKMETAYEQRESTITAAEIMGRFGGGGGGGGGPRGGGGGGMIDSEELTTLRDQRRDLDNATVEKVQALLNEEQKAKLPQQRGGRGDRGGDAGGQGGAGGGGGGGGGGGNGNGNGRRNRPNNNQPTPNGRT